MAIDLKGTTSIPVGVRTALGLAFSPMLYGAVGDGTTDDTAAIEAAHTAAQAAEFGVLWFSAGKRFRYTGTGLEGTYITVAGGGTVVLDAGKFLILTDAAFEALRLADITFEGGGGAVKQTYTGADTVGAKIVERCRFIDYTECAIASDSSDSPYWRIEKCLFYAVDSEDTIGVALPADPSNSTIRSNAFWRNRVHLKIRQGGLAALVDGNDFIAADAGDSGSPRAKVWLVPHTSTTNAGNGFRLTGNKFGNENMQTWDRHIVVADEGAGASNGVKMPDVGSASTGHLIGVTLEGNRFSGSGGSGRADVFSTTPNLQAVFGANEHDGTVPSYLFEFLSGVTPGSSCVLDTTAQLRTPIPLCNVNETTVSPGYKSGWYYGPPVAITTAIRPEALLEATQWDVEHQVTLSQLRLEVTVVGTAGAVVRLGLYGCGDDGTPDKLIVDAGTIDGTSATDQAKTVNVTLQPGRYFLAAAVQGAAGTRPTTVVASTVGLISAGSAFSNMNQFPPVGHFMSSVTGALPSTFVSEGGDNNPHRVVVKVA